MVDKIQDRPCEALKSLMGYQQADMVLASRQAIHEVSDYISKLEHESRVWRAKDMQSERLIHKINQQRDELVAVVEKVAEAHFDLSLHKQHDTLTYLKKVAANALAKLGADASHKSDTEK
jgi:glutamine synthetase type III